MNPWPVLLPVLLLAQVQASLPTPDLSGLEPGVQNTLEAAREALIAAVDNPQLDPAQRGRLWGHTGQVFHAHHVFEVAAACYRNAAALEPKKVLWPYLQGYLQQDTSRLLEAKVAYLGVLELEPDHALASLRLAQVHLELAEIDAAAPLLEKLRGEKSLAAPVRAALGKIAVSRGQLAEAAAHYEAALAAQPQASQLHYPLAVAYRRLGDVDKAREHAALGGTAKVRVADPILDEVGSLSVSSEMFLTTGAQALKIERYDLAAKAFRAAIAVNPENKRAHLNLAVVLAHEGDLEAAEQSARSALRLAPDYHFAYFNLGTIYEARGQLREAMDYYEKALAGDPANLKANFRYANALMRTGDYELAAQHYGAAVERAPSFVQARYLQALALIALERFGAARPVLEEALEIAPGQAHLAAALARILATSEPMTDGDARRALELARGLAAGGDSSEHSEVLAMALAAAGRYEEAVAVQQAVLQAAGRLGDAGRHLEYNLERYRSGSPSDRPWPVESGIP